MNIERPSFVQRCTLTSDRLEYDYMGNAHFEVGDQGKSLRRIFSRGIQTTELTVRIGGKNVTVYMLAGKGFNGYNANMYLDYLQQMANGTLRLEESPRFYEAICAFLKLEGSRPTRINAWFDFRNDVLWTIDENIHLKLVERLRIIEQAWAEVQATKK